MAAPSVLDDGEIWKPVVGFPYYQVSNYGRVWSPRRAGHCGGFKVPYVRLGRSGRPACVTVMLAPAPGKTKSVRVHHLVLEAFVGPRPPRYQACHYDGDPTSNRLENLRWDTAKANIRDCYRHGTKVEPPVHYGEKHHNAKLTDAEIAKIRAAHPAPGYKAALARRYGVSKTSISRYLKGLSRNGERRQTQSRPDPRRGSEA